MIKIIISVTIISLLIAIGVFFSFNYSPDILSVKRNSLTIGVFPRRSIPKTVEMFEPLAEHIEKVTGLPTKLVTTKSFISFWNNVKNKKYDIVHYNQLHFVISHDKYGYDVIAKNNERGSSTLRSTIVVRKDSNINSLKDLKNKTIYFGGGKLAFMSHTGNRIALRESGLSDSDYKWRFSKTPFKALISVFNKEADAAGVGDVVIKTKFIRNEITVGMMKTIYVGPEIAHLPWAVRNNMPTALTKKIKTALTTLQDTEQGRALLKNARINAILPAQDSEYDTVRDMHQQYLDASQ